MPIEGRKPLDRVIAHSEKLREGAIKEYEKELDSQEGWRREFGKFERKKTSEEKTAIAFVDETLTGYLHGEYGISVRKMPEHAVHMIQEKWWRKLLGRDIMKGAPGMAVDFSVMIKDEGLTKAGLLQYLLHEGLHFKEYKAFQVSYSEPEDREEFYDSGYRLGMRIHSRSNSRKHRDEQHFFLWLQEGIIQTLAMRVMELILRNPPYWFSAEAANILSERKDVAPRIEDEQEILPYYVVDHFFGKGVLWRRGNYPDERRNIRNLIHALGEKFPDRLRNQDETFRLFVEATFAGNLLPVARLIEEALGKGSFRKLGEGRIAEVLLNNSE